VSNILEGNSRTEPVGTYILKRISFSQKEKGIMEKGERRQKKIEKIIINLQSPLMSSEYPFLTLLKT
jgi:hypothetical protein